LTRHWRTSALSPYILQRYEKPSLVDVQWFDFDNDRVELMPGRVRLSPYYFVSGQGDAARANLGGVLATVSRRTRKSYMGCLRRSFPGYGMSLTG